MIHLHMFLTCRSLSLAHMQVHGRINTLWRDTRCASAP